ncbi:5-oxoprolinase subunit PxpB [Neolewinella persica]|uniref:5-oxoprolinase subunit PxpB n=1 Tax=Neolewinella persica TaxID=70998 RepID=UPI00037AFE75|nr:5-oxoprolinase subunit PxpB [Neolewinella persica]
MRLPRHILPYGPDALLINWEQRIAPAISTSVHAYAAKLLEHPGVLECIPAYASLMVRFSIPKISAYRLREFIFELRLSALEIKKPVVHELPVLYDGPDLDFVVGKLQLSKKQLINLHTKTDYLVYQVGFQPGFAFLGDTAEALTINRKESPRSNVPAGSVGLAGRQTGIYPADGPGGWNLIGRCPWSVVRPGDDPTRLRAGDRVKFRSVSAAAFLKLSKSPAPWPER